MFHHIVAISADNDIPDPTGDYQTVFYKGMIDQNLLSTKPLLNFSIRVELWGKEYYLNYSAWALAITKKEGKVPVHIVPLGDNLTRLQPMGSSYPLGVIMNGLWQYFKSIGAMVDEVCTGDRGKFFTLMYMPDTALVDIDAMTNTIQGIINERV